MPTEVCQTELWPFRGRLPLGDGYKGYCAAPGFSGVQPSNEELKECCNLGYARQCPRLPQERAADAVRFSVVRHQEQKIQICYVFELRHLPGEHGALEYDLGSETWPARHPDERVQRMAECVVEAYLRRNGAR